MATRRRIKLRISIKNQLKDYKGFGKLKNGMLRNGFSRLQDGQIVSNNDLEKAMRE